MDTRIYCCGWLEGGGMGCGGLGIRGKGVGDVESGWCLLEGCQE